MEKTFNTPQNTRQISFTNRATDKFVATEEVEIISAFPSSKIIFKVEEILPLDASNSDKHRDVVTRQRKRRRTKPSSAVIPSDEPMDIVWKDTPIDPSENLKKLSQFAGAYASTTIDKAVEVRQLLREKEEMIMQLEQQYSEERKSIDNEMKAEMSQLQ